MICTNWKTQNSEESLPTEQEEEPQTEDTEATDTTEDSDYYPETDADSASECTMIPVVNTDAVSPETNTLPTPIEKVGCPFIAT